MLNSNIQFGAHVSVPNQTIQQKDGKAIPNLMPIIFNDSELIKGNIVFQINSDPNMVFAMSMQDMISMVSLFAQRQQVLSQTQQTRPK